MSAQPGGSKPSSKSVQPQNKRVDNPKEQGQTGNIRQNITNQGHQQDR